MVFVLLVTPGTLVRFLHRAIRRYFTPMINCHASTCTFREKNSFDQSMVELTDKLRKAFWEVCAEEEREAQPTPERQDASEPQELLEEDAEDDEEKLREALRKAEQRHPSEDTGRLKAILAKTAYVFAFYPMVATSIIGVNQDLLPKVRPLT